MQPNERPIPPSVFNSLLYPKVLSALATAPNLLQLSVPLRLSTLEVLICEAARIARNEFLNAPRG